MRIPAFLTVTLAATPIAAAPLKILTDIPVTASLVQQVAGDHAEVEVLLDRGADPHDFQLRPSQARALKGTDLLFWVGPEMTPWLSRAAAQLGRERQLGLLADAATQRRDYAAGGHDHDHGPADAHAEEHDHDHGHEDAEAALEFDPDLDPHAWLDPENGAAWLDVIAARLGQLDPENAALYAENAAASRQRLAETDAALAAGFEAVRGQSFITFHDAYGYLTAHYGLPPAISITLGDASAPSAARLSAVQAQIAGAGAACAFPEVGHASTALETVIAGTGVRMGEPLSPEGSDLDAGPMLYTELLTQLGQRITACLDAES